MNQLDLIDIYWTHQTRPKHAFSLSTNGTFTTIDISLVIRHTLLLSRPALCDPWTAAHWASWSLTVSWSFAQVRLCISDALQPSHPLMPSSPSAFRTHLISLKTKSSKELMKKSITDKHLENSPNMWKLNSMPLDNLRTREDISAKLEIIWTEWK